MCMIACDKMTSISLCFLSQGSGHDILSLIDMECLLTCPLS